MKRYYIAYGSNLNVQQMKFRCPTVYIMHEERKLGIPSYAYVKTCVQGYRDFGFDLKHLRLAFDISERGVRNENG